MRLLPGLALALVVGLVLATDGSAPVAGLVGVSALLGVGGILGRSVPLIRASAGVSVAAYALALLVVAPEPGVVTPALIGAGLALLLVTGDAMARGRGGPVDHRGLGAWLGDVVRAPVLGAVGAVLLGATGSRVVLDLPASVYPVVAAVAALAVLVGTGRGLLARASASGIRHDEGA